jgi:hypothetical protein
MKITRNNKEIQDRISAAQNQHDLQGYEMQPEYAWAAVGATDCDPFAKVFDMRDDIRDGLSLAGTDEFTARCEFAATTPQNAAAVAPNGTMIIQSQVLGPPEVGRAA